MVEKQEFLVEKNIFGRKKHIFGRKIRFARKNYFGRKTRIFGRKPTDFGRKPTDFGRKPTNFGRNFFWLKIRVQIWRENFFWRERRQRQTSLNNKKTFGDNSHSTLFLKFLVETCLKRVNAYAIQEPFVVHW
jgi:hypothetical protein